MIAAASVFAGMVYAIGATVTYGTTTHMTSLTRSDRAKLVAAWPYAWFVTARRVRREGNPYLTDEAMRRMEKYQ